MANYKRYLVEAGYYVGAGVGGFILLWEGIGKALPAKLSEILAWGLELGSFSITLKALVGALAIYLVVVKLSKN